MPGSSCRTLAISAWRRRLSVRPTRQLLGLGVPPWGLVERRLVRLADRSDVYQPIVEALKVFDFFFFLLDWEKWRQNPMALRLAWSVELKFGIRMTRLPNVMLEYMFLEVPASAKARFCSGKRIVRKCSADELNAYRRVREASAERPLLVKYWTEVRRRDDQVAEIDVEERVPGVAT